MQTPKTLTTREKLDIISNEVGFRGLHDDAAELIEYAVMVSQYGTDQLIAEYQRHFGLYQREQVPESVPVPAARPKRTR